MQKVLKIQYILILCSLLIFSITVFFKSNANKEFQLIDSQIAQLQFKNELSEDLSSRLLPFVYFDQQMEEEFNTIVLLHQNNEPLIDETITFQNHLHQVQQTLRFGYDCTLYIAILIGVIGILVILTKNFLIKTEATKKQAMNEAQIKFSRDLHDGVAQDLAALKVYLKKDDADKTNFYADQAFKEIRYMIDSLRLDFNGDFEKILREAVESFSTNYQIETKFLCASHYLNALKPEIQIEIFRILQEALSNIARHANATVVTVKITDIGSDINFIISDNGTGFSQKEVENRNDSKHHYGLTNIKERVSALGGTVNFITTEGTTIAIIFKNLIH